MPAKSLELQHTIRLIRELDAEIHEIEAEIETMMDEIQSPITTIPGIGYRMGAMIWRKLGISLASLPQTNCWLMLVCRRLLTSPGN